MHSTNLYPAGVGLELDHQPDGHYLKAEVVEDTAKKLVQKGVLRAFSVGIARPKIIRDQHARGGRVVDGTFAEVSLVDRPANANCKFTLCKYINPQGDSESTIEFINELEATTEFVTKVVSGPDYDGDQELSDNSNDAILRETTGGLETADPANPYLSTTTKAKKDGMDGGGDDDDMKEGDDDDDCNKADGKDGKGKDDDGKMGDDDKDDDKDKDDCAKTQWSAVPPPEDVNVHGTLHDDESNKLDDTADNNTPKDALGKGNRDVLTGRFNQTRNATAPGEPNPQIKSIDYTDTTTVTRTPRADESVTLDDFVGKSVLTPAEAALKWHNEVMEAQDREPIKPIVPDSDPVEKRDMDPNVGGGVDRDKLPDSDFAGPHRSYPIVTPKDVSDAAHLVGKADDPDAVRSRVISIAHRKGKAFVDALPASWKTSDKFDASQYLIKRFHDILCPAYNWADVLDAYPGLDKETYPDIIKSAQVVLYHTLNSYLESDNGSGEYADKLINLTHAYHAANNFPDLDPTILTDARAELYKDFLVSNSNGPEPPKPMDQPKPGQFQRPLITAGLAQATARAGQTPKWPGKTHQISPDEFDRGLITAGHESDSPSNKSDTSDTSDTDTDLTKATNENSIRIRYGAMSALSDFHDHFTNMDATYCCLTPADAGTPVTAYTGGSDPISPSTQVSAQSRIDLASVPDLVKLAAQSLIEDEKVTYLNKISELQSSITEKDTYIEELESLADPAKAPYLGVAMARRQTNRTSHKAQVTGQAEVEQAEFIAWLQKSARSGNPDIRNRAIAKLQDLGQYPT